LSTVRVLAAGLRRLEYDLVLAGADTSDGGAGVVAAGVAVSVGLPYLSYAARIEPGDGRVVVHRLSPVGYDVIEAALPALVVATQALGEPRYPSLRGIMAARSKEISTWSLADLELGDAPVGGAVASTQVVSARPAASRGATRVIREPAAAAAAQVVEFLAERRLI
jgi:electron transfer flavoprotein beta subunit